VVRNKSGLGVYCEAKGFKFSDAFIYGLDEELGRKREGKCMSRDVGLAYGKMDIFLCGQKWWEEVGEDLRV
jgi:hypothetical protein